MNCNWSNIDLGWRMGAVDDMTKEAIEIATLLNTKVSFEFNGVLVNVTKYSSVSPVASSALLAVQERKGSVFGEGW